MKLYKIIIYFSLVILTSCNVAYVPNSINSPMLRNKGDVQVNAIVGSSGIEGQGAIAFTDQFGLIANAQYLITKEADYTERYSLGEIGLGYTERFSDRGIFEIFTGGGIGMVPADFRDNTYDGTQTAHLNKVFIQPAIGMVNDWLDLSVASRYSAININGETNWFFEPAVISKIGFKRVKFIGTMGICIPFSKYDNRTWDQAPFFISIGIHLKIGKYKGEE